VSKKNIALKSIQVSDVMDTFSPSIYLLCQIVNTAQVFRVDVSEVSNNDALYTVNRRIADFTWNNGTMANSGTCGIFEEDTGSDDSLGIMIVHFDDITTDGGQFGIVGDPNSFIVLFDCQSDDQCSSSGIVQISLILVALLAFV